MENHKIKPLKYQELNGVSQRQIAEHHDFLYAGYVKKLNEIEEKLKNVDRAQANGVYSELGELKRQEIFATNGKYLHEKYFDNMISGGNALSEELLEKIKKDFGSYEKWEEDFKASSMAARGWVVLAYNLEDGKLHNYSQDAHDKGAVWNCITILVFDVYEHSYFIDYGVKRKDYIEAFFKNIDWNEAYLRFKKAKNI